METKLIARGGALALVALTIGVSALALRDEPSAPAEVTVPKPAPIDRLEILLRECGGLGEAAASDPACRAAWAEKQRRFLGVNAAKSGGQ